MSAEQSARTVRQADGLDPVRALQRVLYPSAKQEPERRFHALYDKLARSDVMWRAWVDVATQPGRPRHRRHLHRRCRSRRCRRGAPVPRRPRCTTPGEDVSPEASAAGPHPKTGQTGGDPAARHSHGHRPGGDGGGEDPPRTCLRGGLLAPELRLPAKALRSPRSRRRPPGGQQGLGVADSTWPAPSNRSCSPSGSEPSTPVPTIPRPAAR